MNMYELAKKVFKNKKFRIYAYKEIENYEVFHYIGEKKQLIFLKFYIDGLKELILKKYKKLETFKGKIYGEYYYFVIENRSTQSVYKELLNILNSIKKERKAREITCKFCGEIFLRYDQRDCKYCSEECRKKLKAKRIEVENKRKEKH